MNSWYVANPKFFQEFKQSIDNKYTTLNVLIENGIVYIRGTLILNALDERELDHYSIEIEIPDNYPKTVPVVREMGGRIPKIADRHFNGTDGTACLFLPEERYKYWPQGSTIIDFIEGPIKSFFLWQTDYDLKKGKSSFGERGHGEKGRLEFYNELIGTEDKTVVKNFLSYLIKKKIKGHWTCYCGSGKRLRHCHFNKIKDLRTKISRDDARKSLEALRKRG